MMLTQKGKLRVKSNEDLMSLLLRMRSYGIEQKALLEAIEITPRDRYLPAQHMDKVHHGRSLPMDCGQNMTSVEQVIRTVHALDLARYHSVLEIGTGTGYQTALISRLAKKVVTLDRYKTLIDQAKDRFDHAGITNIVTRQKDGLDDIAGTGLYDRIVANGVFPGLPKQYLDQIASGGSMVAAIGEPFGEQMLALLTKVGSRFERKDLFPVRMSPFMPGIAEYL